MTSSDPRRIVVADFRGIWGRVMSMRGGRALCARELVQLFAALAACGFAAVATPARAHAADLQATPATFASVLASSKGGDRILLASGDYGTFSRVSKSSMVTITAQPGA